MTRNYLDILAETIRNNWDCPALTDFYLTKDRTSLETSRGNHYTYGEMYTKVVQVCEMFSTLGLQKGDHIAICGANSAHWIIAYLAIAKIQGIAVTMMHFLPAEQLVKMLVFSDVKAFLVDNDIWNKLKGEQLLQNMSVVSLEDWSILQGKAMKEFVLQTIPINSQYLFPQGESEELSTICFTAGTTGSPKGVMLPYRSINANIEYLYEYYCKTIKSRNVILALPLSHSYGLLNEFIRPMCVGTHIHILKEVFTAKDLITCCEIIHPAYLVLVPQTFQIIVNSSLDILKKLCLNEIYIGGAGMTVDFVNQISQYKLPITTGYGATECGPIISATLPKEYRIGSVGKVLPTIELSFSSIGEILVRGEHLMLGYYKDPEATARKIDKDGWLHTGDKGHLDEDGYLYVEGRLEQDIIVLPNGENIRPDNIESLINALPEVSESIVLARDGKLVAIVVPQITNDQSPMTNTDLRRMILRNVNPLLPLYSQLYDVEITDVPLQKTEKQTIKRYLYK